MKIQLSDHFTYKKLLRFTLPSIAMMIFLSIYGVADGYFISNFVGKTSLAAVNFIWPIILMLGTLGVMFGAGGSALISKTYGEGNKKKANQLFSFLVYTSIICGVILSVLGFLIIRPVAVMLGAESEMLEQCVIYGKIIIVILPFYILQMEFQTFLVAAEKPQLGLFVTIASGIANFVLDALFIVVFKWGVAGAAIATAAGQFLGGLIPLIYFLRPNKSLFRLTTTKFYIKDLAKVCTNGSSELLNGISSSFVSMLYNTQLIKYGGEDAVAAFSVMMYVTMVFCGVFMGYSNGTAPITSYHYGAENHCELKNLFKKGTKIIAVFSVIMFVFAEILANPLSNIFVGYNQELMKLTVNGFRIYALNFLFVGIAVYASSLFTALNNGSVSAAIAFFRTFVFQIGTIFLFPMWWGVDGIWISIAVAELLSALVAIAFLITKKSKYHY